MPLPPQVAERLAREPIQAAGWMTQFIVFSASVFLITLVVYLGLVFGYEPYLQSRNRVLDDEINTTNQQIPISDQQKLASFYSQLSNLRNILGNRNSVSAVLVWLENNTEVNIYYNNFDFNAANWQLSLTGGARTINDFEQELQSWENSPVVDKVSINTLATDNSGFWKFDVVLFLNKNGLASISTPSTSSTSP